MSTLKNSKLLAYRKMQTVFPLLVESSDPEPPSQGLHLHASSSPRGSVGLSWSWQSGALTTCLLTACNFDKSQLLRVTDTHFVLPCALLSTSSSTVMTQAFTNSCLYYCNSLINSRPASKLDPEQSYESNPFDHVILCFWIHRTKSNVLQRWHILRLSKI